MSVIAKAVEWINPFKGKFDDLGQLIPDSRPMEAAISHTPPESLADQIRRMTAIASQEARRQGAESFEEANDFYVPEDDDPPGSRYDLDDEAPPGFGLSEIEAFLQSGGDPNTPIGHLLQQFKPMSPVTPEAPDSSPPEPPSKPAKKPKAGLPDADADEAADKG